MDSTPVAPVEVEVVLKAAAPAPVAIELEVVSVKVTKAGHDLSKHLSQFVQAIEDALANGWQVTDGLTILNAAMAELVPCIGNLKHLAPERAANPEAFYTGLLLGLRGLIK